MTTAVAVTERPILFSGPMVRAILEGRKTQTRRVMKPQPFLNHSKDGNWWFLERTEDGDGPTNSAWREHDAPFWTYCPYGVPGDRLWVRETWMPMTEDGTDIGVPIYRATDQPEPDGDRPLRWRPSIFMKREDSRITLEITAVRVERVQEISEQDAKAEGAGISLTEYPGWDGDPDCYRKLFRERWNQLSEKRGFGWDKNPWVWVVEFRTVIS